MRDKKQGLFAMFGRAAKDASQEELDQMVQDAASMLESEPAKAQEPAPVESKPAADATPAGGGSDAKLDKLIELVTALCAQKDAPTDDSPEAQIDKTISGLEKKPDPEDVKDEPAGAEGDPGAKVIGADSAEQGTLMGDAAVQILKNARPAIAAMKDLSEKKAVTDALLKSIRASVETPGADLLKATADAAKQHVQDADPTARGKAQQAAYDARNPHRMKKEDN